jgi:hypothetical protein
MHLSLWQCPVCKVLSCRVVVFCVLFLPSFFHTRRGAPASGHRARPLCAGQSCSRSQVDAILIKTIAVNAIDTVAQA